MSERQPRDRTGRNGREQQAASESTPSDDVTGIEQYLPSDTARAWRALAPHVPYHAYLAGGTAITVHLQHRISRDLDFFTEQSFDPDDLASSIDEAGDFAPTMIEEGTLNGVFEGTKVQFLEAIGQRLIEPPIEFGRIRVAQLLDLLATKLKVIQDRGELRDYFDIMTIEKESGLRVEQGLTALVEKYQPRAPEGVVAGVVRGLGYLGDVGDDPTLPASRADIETYWTKRQPELLRSIQRR